jgi:threonine dehydrogenase-like Zn-dependent dehydrogenase
VPQRALLRARDQHRDGYASERFRIAPQFAVRLAPELGLSGVLLEPASVVAKAWDQIDRIGRRLASWRPRTILITGAGPIGLLASLMGVQRGYEVHVLDRVTEGPKPGLVHDMGAAYHVGELGELKPDIVIECTGVTPVILDAINRIAPDGLVCLAGVSSGGHVIKFDIGELNRAMVLENTVIFGTVNANRSHYESAAAVLAETDKSLLLRMITRRAPLRMWRDAFERHPNDVKAVIEFAE